MAYEALGSCSRRIFISRCAALAGGVTLVGGCTGDSQPKDISNVLIPLGDLASLTAMGRLEFRLERVAVVRDAGGLAAVSLTCSHQDCLIAAEGSGFRCPCHGSEFSSAGAVLTGPAERALPWFEVGLLDNRRFGFFPGRIVPATWRLWID